MKKYLYLVIPGIITIIKCLLFVPVHVSGGIAGLNEVKYFPIVYLFEDAALSTDCVDCIYTTLHTSRFILEGIITFSISFILLLIIVKLKNKKKRKKG
ncbi:MAG: hypothetical protein IJI58_03385 [Bacilli bacterium]|nr:hypothetical protein [Bacilli bacterium]